MLTSLPLYAMQLNYVTMSSIRITMKYEYKFVYGFITNYKEH